MYLGKIVEKAGTREIFRAPLHPYSTILFSAVPIPNPNLTRERLSIKGEIPSPINPPSGCRFHTRCPRAMDICRRVMPELKDVEEGHLVACHLYG
jgi:oligopeptide/dipeptide ABC transporter ATP-binding protein